VFPKTAEVNYSLKEYLDCGRSHTDWGQFNGWHKRQWLSSLRDKNEGLSSVRGNSQEARKASKSF